MFNNKLKTNTVINIQTNQNVLLQRFIEGERLYKIDTDEDLEKLFLEEDSYSIKENQICNNINDVFVKTERINYRNIFNLSDEYKELYSEVKNIINSSNIKHTKNSIHINNENNRFLSTYEKVILLRIVNFSLKKNKIIIYNNELLYIPEEINYLKYKLFLTQIEEYIK